MSWLEDFSDGQAVWRRLMSTPTLDDWIVAEEKLKRREREVILLYLAIREKQATGEWDNLGRQVQGVTLVTRSASRRRPRTT